MNEKWPQQYQQVFHLMKTLPKWQTKTDTDFRSWLASGMLTGTQLAVLQGVDEETPRRWRKNGLKIGETETGTPLMVYLEAINGEGIRGKPVIHTRQAIKRFLEQTGIRPTADLAWVLSYNDLMGRQTGKAQLVQESATEAKQQVLDDESDRLRMMELQLKRMELEKKQLELELEKTKLELEIKRLGGI